MITNKEKTMKRNTIHKEIILNAVNELACHVTSETVYDYIHEKYPHISKSTVYRNLRSLADDHLIKKNHPSRRCRSF